MTLSQTLKLATAKLRAKHINLPHLEAEILLSAVLKKPREFLLAHGEIKLSSRQISKYQLFLKKRLKGEPVAYLTGHKEFYGLDFTVNKNVLIPRPETELIVEEALKLVARDSQPVTLVDVGTGSGCIIISLIKNLTPKFPASNFQFLATDISISTLAVAKKNAKFHNTDKNIKFIKGDLLKPALNSKFVIRNSKLIILANLPYGWKAWKNNCSLDSAGLKFEPKIALFTGKNGLELYEKLLKQIKQLTNSRKFSSDSSIFAFLEFDPRQTVMIKKLIKKHLPQAQFQIKKDLAGLNRLAVLTIPATR